MKELDSTNGTITVSGERLEKMKHRRVAKYRRKQGVVFQDFRLLKDRNIYDNVAFAQKVIGESNRSIKRNVPSMLSMVGLAAKYRSYPRQLSGGEQQRVAVARALITNPDVIFADEPSGSLDSHNKEELHRLFFDLRDRFNQTFVIVTHDEGLAAMCDRTLKMRDGRIIDQTTNNQQCDDCQ